jgi:ATP-dependent DNA helicase PIF1
MELEKLKYQLMSEQLSTDIKLSEKQNIAYKLMTEGKSIFLTGAAGSGKTAVIKMFIEVYKSTKIMGVTSTTGISALLFGGTTIHSFLGIGLGQGSVESIVGKIYKNPPIRKRWGELEVLIIDEISMLSPVLFDKLESIARRIRHNEKPFGGIQLILSGDFLQLPCIGSDYFCFESKSWDRCLEKVVYLTEIMRQKEVEFQECLNNIRVGLLPKKTKKLLNTRVGIKLTNDFGIKPTKLFSTNHSVDYINNKELDILAESDPDFFEYNMEIHVYPGVKNKDYAIEKYKKCCNAPEILQLCVGAQVMLLWNLDTEGGLVNGSRGVITSFVGDIPMVKFLNGRELFINHNIWECEEQDKKILRVVQIPLKLAYALTIHKSQGCSLDYAEIDLSNTFANGQAYVALSRVKKLDGLSIIDIDFDKIVANEKAIAFYESLSEE